MASTTATPRIMTREELNRRLWQAADILRGTVDAGDFKNHILALLFLKRLSDVFYERRQEIIDEWLRQGKTRPQAETIADDPDEYGGGSYYVPSGARWDDLMKVGENRAEAIDKALLAIEDRNGQYLEGVLEGIRFNDARRFGDPQTMDSMMQRLLSHFGGIPLGNRNLAEPDVLGNAYEYLIERFAEGSGKKGGEFYTPRMVVKLIAQLLQPAEGMRIHDPTCGSGGMLIECGNYVRDRGGDPRNVTLTGQEKNYGTWSICKLNMLLHNVPDADIRTGDTILSPRFERAGVLDVFDRVIANPPFSLKEWHGVEAKRGKDGDEAKVDPKAVRERFENDPYHRFSRGIPPATKGDTAFLQHMVAVCRDSGMVGVVMPHGVLFRGGSEGEIRKALLQEDLVEAVIGLPEKLFFGTGIPAAVLILNKCKPAARRGHVLFVDASPAGLYQEGKNRNYLRQEDILRIAAVFHAWADPAGIDAWLAEERQAVLAAAHRHHEQRVAQIRQAGGPDVEVEIADSLCDEGTEVAAFDDAATAVRAWLGAARGIVEGEAPAEPVRGDIVEDEAPAEPVRADIVGGEAPAEPVRLTGRDGGLRNPTTPARSPLAKFAAVVSLDTIAKENDHNLNISRYVDSTEPPPELDVACELRRLRELEAKRNAAETRMDQLLKELGYREG